MSLFHRACCQWFSNNCCSEKQSFLPTRAAAYTNNSQSVLLNMLSSEFSIIENPFDEEESITGLYLLNKNLFLHTKLRYAYYDMRGALIEKQKLEDVTDEWELLCKQ